MDILKMRFRDFFNEESGAVTVDWVVLTAGLVMLGMAAAFAVGANLPGLADSISGYMTSYDVGGTG